MYTHKFGNNKENEFLIDNHIIEIQAKDNKVNTPLPSSTLKKKFDPPLEYENYEIALLEIINHNTLIDITNDNNIIEIMIYKSKPDPSWFRIEIPLGCYTPSTLYTLLFQLLRIGRGNMEFDSIITFPIKDNKATLKVNPEFSVRFTDPNSFGKVIGFSRVYNIDSKSSKRNSTPLEYKTDKEITSVYNGLINVHLDCIENTYINNKESNLIYSFSQQGPKVYERPYQLIYFPLKNNIKDFKVELKDKNNNNICLDDFYLKFHIKK